jgi:hypothetical protein
MKILFNQIRQGLAKQGGYVLQIDGTVSVKTKTLYIFRDNISGTVLYAALARDEKEMLPTVALRISLYVMCNQPRGILNNKRKETFINLNSLIL